MYARSRLRGPAFTSTYTCVSGGICRGTAWDTKSTFIKVQAGINRLGPPYGISRIAVTGDLGPETFSALAKLARGLRSKFPLELDASIEKFAVQSGLDASDIAADADAIYAALDRNGAHTGADIPAPGIPEQPEIEMPEVVINPVPGHSAMPGIGPSTFPPWLIKVGYGVAIVGLAGSLYYLATTSPKAGKRR